MKCELWGRLFTALCVVLGIILMCTCSYASTPKAENKVGPKAFFPEKEFDTGEILEGKPIVHDFVVQNKGDKELQIIKVRPG